jgi:hypothetical protein
MNRARDPSSIPPVGRGAVYGELPSAEPANAKVETPKQINASTTDRTL